MKGFFTILVSSIIVIFAIVVIYSPKTVPTGKIVYDKPMRILFEFEDLSVYLVNDTPDTSDFNCPDSYTPVRVPLGKQLEIDIKKEGWKMAPLNSGDYCISDTYSFQLME